ncbi:MAG: hypothetical protein JRH14_13305 [Deltaproteobacteria bacterium]|nr:hypothetical protein [Deltaproteobacteria bacterium]MBW2160916.1 hypothetical protein [Deltaproteobacteria bacterium]MBW2379991.1 hypothetical protein [Deltaproteobacteria bacterium]
MTNISTSASVLIPRPRHEVFALATDSTNASLLRSRGPFAGIPCPRRPRAEKPVNDYLHRPAEELYDPEADPDEQHNIADDPEVRALKLDLRSRLEDWMTAQGDVHYSAELFYALP